METINRARSRTKVLMIAMVILTTLSLFGRPGSFNVKKSITYEEARKRVEKVVAWHISTTNAIVFAERNGPVPRRYDARKVAVSMMVAECEAEYRIFRNWRWNDDLDSDSRKILYQVLKKRGYCFIGDLSLSGRTEIHCPHCKAVETLKLRTHTLQTHTLGTPPEKGQGSEAP